jgi:hypothetical protein
MSAHNRTRRWLRCLVVPGVLAVSMAAISTVSAKPRAGLAVMHDPTASVATNALTAGPSAGNVLGGITSQGWPVVVEISKNGKRIDQVAIGLNMSCTSGIKYGFDDGWNRLPFGPHGKIHASAVIPPSPAPSGESFTGGSDSLTGTLNRQKSTFSGVWDLILTFKDSTGHADKCDSGRVTFSARL